MIVLGRWSVSQDFASSLRAAYFGIKIGGVTFVGVVAARRRRGFGDRHGGDPRAAELAVVALPAAHPARRRRQQLDPHHRRLCRRARRAGDQRRSARPRLPEAGDRRRRAVGRHRLRPAVDRQQFRFRPDPVVGARHQGRRLDRGRRRSGLRQAHQRARHRDRDLRPRHADRAQRDAGRRPGEELDARRPHRPHRRGGQRRLRERRRDGARDPHRRRQGAGFGAGDPGPAGAIQRSSATGR